MYLLSERQHSHQLQQFFRHHSLLRLGSISRVLILREFGMEQLSRLCFFLLVKISSRPLIALDLFFYFYFCRRRRRRRQIHPFLSSKDLRSPQTFHPNLVERMEMLEVNFAYCAMRKSRQKWHY